MIHPPSSWGGILGLDSRPPAWNHQPTVGRKGWPNQLWRWNDLFFVDQDKCFCGRLLLRAKTTPQWENKTWTCWSHITSTPTADCEVEVAKACQRYLKRHLALDWNDETKTWSREACVMWLWGGLENLCYPPTDELQLLCTQTGWYMKMYVYCNSCYDLALICLWNLCFITVNRIGPGLVI